MSATGFAGWLGNKQVEKGAVGCGGDSTNLGLGRESCREMQGGDCGSPVENVLCTCGHTAAKPSGRSQKSLGSDPDSATHRQGRLAISHSLSYCLSVYPRNRSTSCCEREERKTWKTCDCIQDRVWHAASGNLVLEPVSHLFFVSICPESPTSRNLQNSCAAGWAVENGRRPQAGGQEGSFYPSPYTGHEDQGSGMRVMCMESRGLILSGRLPSLPHPGTRQMVFPARGTKRRHWHQGFYAPRILHFQDSQGPLPSSIHLLDPRHLSTLPPLAKTFRQTSLSCELGRPPAGQRLHNPWRLLKVSERLTTLSGPGGRESLSRSLSFLSFIFFFWPCKDK